MRTDADDVQTTCSAVGELSRARKQRQRQKLEDRATHGIPPRRPREQACPLTIAQTGIAVCDRPHVFDYRCLLWAMLPPRLPTTAPAAPRNGVDDLSCTYLRLAPSPCAQLPAWGFPRRSPSARPSRAPCSHTRAPRRSGHRPCPAIHVAGHVWPPIALSRNHRPVREPGPLLPLS